MSTLHSAPETPVPFASHPQLDYGDFFEIYAVSHYGAHHATTPLRFTEGFGYDRDSMLTDLGDDVHPVRHMRYTHDAIVIPFINDQHKSDRPLTQDEVIALRLGALTHDMGECTHPELEDICEPVGDIRHGNKTEDDEATETLIRGYLRQQLYQHLDQDVLERADRVVSEPTATFEGRIFALCERIGYYKTAIRAGKLAIEEIGRRAKYDRTTYSDERLSQLSALATAVSASHIPVLQSHRDEFPNVDNVLAQTTAVFDRIQLELGTA